MIGPGQICTVQAELFSTGRLDSKFQKLVFFAICTASKQGLGFGLAAVRFSVQG
jgi:hypothetical protein